MKLLTPFVISLLCMSLSAPVPATEKSLLEELFLGRAAHAAENCSAGYREILVLDGVIYCSSTPPDSKRGKYGCGEGGTERCRFKQDNPCMQGYRACKPPGADMAKAFCCAHP